MRKIIRINLLAILHLIVAQVRGKHWLVLTQESDLSNTYEASCNETWLGHSLIYVLQREGMDELLRDDVPQHPEADRKAEDNV